MHLQSTVLRPPIRPLDALGGRVGPPPLLPMDPLLFDVILASLPLLALTAITWRLVWPRWKLVAKLLVHPALYALLSLLIGHWSILVAWLHQGLLGVGVHVWFSRRHGFTWYAVEDPDRYIALSKATVGVREGDEPPR